VALRPEQIKSAISNSGAFDPTDPDMLAGGARLTPEENLERTRIEYDAALKEWNDASNAAAAATDPETKSRLGWIRSAAYARVNAAAEAHRQAIKELRESRAQVDMFQDYEDKERAHAARVAVIKEASEDVAKKLGFPLDKLSYSDEPYIFDLEGKKVSAAGTAQRSEGTIKIYPAVFREGTPDSVRRSAEMVMAHEVGHIRFEAVYRARGREMINVNAEPHIGSSANGVTRTVGPMHADGTLRPGLGLEKKYPVTAVTAPLDRLWGKLGKEDGVTEYSRAWWRAYEATEATRHVAMHETFAEISMLDYENKKKEKPETLAKLGVKPAWRKLYRAYTKAFEAIQKAQKKAAIA
jgi:hypothetical protein